MKALIVEDEQALLRSMADFLTAKGFVCETATTFHLAHDKVCSFDYDVVLLDITLPGGNGLDILKTLKSEQPSSGVLIISAKNSLDDKVHGLDLGADDYLAKPFHLTELGARINSIIRRRNFEGKTNLCFNEIEIDPAAQQATVGGQPLELTQKEFGLLLYFIVNKNRVLTKSAIAEHLWGDHTELADSLDFIYSHVKNLRKKIAEKGGQNYVKTVYGMGYKFSGK
jgi:DNA-binding response OmpR family regulator